MTGRIAKLSICDLEKWLAETIARFLNASGCMNPRHHRLGLGPIVKLQ